MSAHKRLPIGPLLEEIERRGGLIEVLSNVGIEPYGDSQANNESVERHRYRVTLDRAEERGWINLFWADDFCMELLNLHPCFVFGETWWNPEQDDLTIADADALAA